MLRPLCLCLCLQAFKRLPTPRLTAGLALSLALSLSGLYCAPGLTQPVSSENNVPSIMHPQRPGNPEYRFHLDTIDPSTATYPRGIGFPGFRGEQQLIIYTPAFGASTGTNSAGLELVVENGVITQVKDGGNTAIPANGFVLSGHGSAASWLARFGQPGAVVALETEPGQNQPDQVLIRLTPVVFQHQVEEAILRAQSRPPVNLEHYQKALQEAQNCQAQVQQQDHDIATPTLVNLAHHCVALAQVAFYNTIASQKNEFRGAWLRPSSVKPEEVRQVVETLKQAHINQIFLETYYQGKTTYPSAVMTEYGLQQHPQFKGSDPVKVWVDEAHHAGIKVNLWAQVFFAGNQKENAEQYGPILTQYPQWRNIQRMALDTPVPMPSQIEPGHFFVDPANPEVREYLQKLLLEMVSRYDIDGLNLDYIRYPASAPANRGNYLETSWGYTNAARWQFRNLIEQERQASSEQTFKDLPKDKTGHFIKPIAKSIGSFSTDPKDLTPTSPLWPRWVAWRKLQVTSFVKDISEKAHALRPNLLVSAVVFPNLDPIYAQKLQDYQRWVNEGYVQALTPIGFSAFPDRMRDQASKLRAQIQDKVPIYAGIFGMYNRNHPVELVRQIDAAHQAGMSGVVLFDWSRLNDDYHTALKEGPFRE